MPANEQPTEVVDPVLLDIQNERTEIVRWSPLPFDDSGAREVYADNFIAGVRHMLERTRTDLAKKGDRFQPLRSDLFLALISLVSAGVSVNPAHQEACILPFRDRTRGGHSITPCLMWRGLRRIAHRHHPLATMQTHVIMSGDYHPGYEPTNLDQPLVHRYAKRADRAVLTKASGALNWEGIEAGYTVFHFLDGRRPLIGYVDGERLRGKLRANKNTNGQAWKAHPTDMVKKTILKTAIKDTLDLSGDACSYIALDGLHEARDTQGVRAHLDAMAPNQQALELLQRVGGE